MNVIIDIEFQIPLLWFYHILNLAVETDLQKVPIYSGYWRQSNKLHLMV